MMYCFSSYSVDPGIQDGIQNHITLRMTIGSVFKMTLSMRGLSSMKDISRGTSRGISMGCLRGGGDKGDS